jgi:hypothetical protein
VSVADLFSALDLAVPTQHTLTNDELTSAARLLATFGFGLEPDPRFAGPLPALKSQVVIFREPAGPTANSLDFLLARTEIEIAALIAAEDGQITADETKGIVDKIKVMAELSNTEKVRLIGYLAYLVSNPPSNRAIKEIANRDINERAIVANAAFETVARKGEIRQQDVLFLERTYDKLSLPKDSLEEKIKSRIAILDENSEIPLLVREDESVPGVPIPPKQSGEQRPRSKLNGHRITEIRADTIRVSAILSEIFESGEDQSQELTDNASVAVVFEAVEPVGALSQSDDRFPGLDPRYALLLSELCADSVLGREEFDDLARKHGLMPSGAMEIINDWGFSRFEEAIIDDGPQIVVMRDLLIDASPDGNY